MVTTPSHDAEPGPRCLIVGPDVRVRRSLAGLLETSGLLDVIGTASGVIETLELASSHRPDVILLDLDRPDADAWLDLVATLRDLCPRCAIAVLSTASTLRSSALAFGADAFVAKTEPAAAIRDAVAALLPGVAARSVEPEAHHLAARKEIGS